MTRAITNNRTVYVGNLPGDVREREIEDLFYKYGRVVDIDLKLPPRPPGYAFVEFSDARDAEDAIRGRDGYDFDGNKLRVELAHGGRGSSGAPPYDRVNHFNSGVGRPSGVSRRSEYRVIVTGLPASASWQDLKDHMRRAGDVCFAQVFRDGSGAMGIVDYTSYEDMKYAIRKLDDSEFRNPFARGYIRIKEDKSVTRKSYSRSRSRSKSRGRSYSRSLSRSYSRSPVKGKGKRSYSRSRSRSRGRSYSRSLSRSPSRGRSISKSRSRSRSLSRSRSRSKSPAKSLSRSRSVERKRSLSRSKSRSFSPAPRTRSASREKSKSPLPEAKRDGRDRSESRSSSPNKKESNPVTEDTNSGNPKSPLPRSPSPSKSPLKSRSVSPSKNSPDKNGKSPANQD